MGEIQNLKIQINGSHSNREKLVSSPLDKLTSPPSLEALLLGPSLYEEIPLEVLDEGAFSSLGYFFGGVAV